MTQDSEGSPSPTAPDGGPSSLADDSLLRPFRESDDPVLTTEEVGNAVPYRRAPVVEGLERLADEGVIKRKRVGEETVWWLPGHTATDEQRGPMPGTTYDYDGGLPRQLENDISTLSAPSEPERAAIYAACHYLAEHGAASSETLRDEVYFDNAAGYDDASSWLRECVRPALAALAGVEHVEDEWRLDLE
jgi:hypothetical protein